MEKSTHLGSNKTGMDMAPAQSKQMQEGVEQYAPSGGSSNAIDQLKRDYIEESDRVGSVPVPASAKGLLKTMMEKFAGNQPATFVNKLGERLGYERTGTRVYDSLILKAEVAQSQGDSTVDIPIDRLRQFRDEELKHFHLLADCMKKLGADPTAETPDADVSSVAGSGMLKVISDPRTSLPQSLEAMLALELTDNAAWELLIKLAEDLGQNDMAEQFREALAEEETHLQEIQGWYETSIREQAATARTH